MLIPSIDLSDETWDEVEKAWAESKQDQDNNSRKMAF